MRRVWRRLRLDRGGAATLEFAIVSVPFLGLILGTATIAYNFYLQDALDLALRAAARQVQLGHVPQATSAGDFAAKLLCPALVAYAPCANLVVVLQPVTDYLSANVVATPQAARLGSAGAFCVGAPGQLMFARVVYLAPAISQFWPYATQASINGTAGTALVSSAAFANENPSGAAVPAAGGC